MREWRYSSTILDLSIRWRSVISFTFRPLYPGQKASGIPWIGGWVGLRGSMNSMEKKKSLTSDGVRTPTSWSSSPQPHQVIIYWAVPAPIFTAVRTSNLTNPFHSLKTQFTETRVVLQLVSVVKAFPSWFCLLLNILPPKVCVSPIPIIMFSLPWN
jgi:hypothetical protein